ncbi:hypothetical protein ACIQUD_32095 [Streptomyces globisporus]|uniref:hypothetical protein n=1 Tax=Streptomyces globisporus TaxID=1908 RepID=UPI003815E323
MSEITAPEYLYELWDANWDDGPLGNYQILRHEITKKTPKRIYFVMRGHSGFVDRQRIEADGEILHGYTLRRLHLNPPEIPGQRQAPSLPELKRAMADAHPDRESGSHEAFIAARARYERARDKASRTEGER